jgi:hypothetical protein
MFEMMVGSATVLAPAAPPFQMAIGGNRHFKQRLQCYCHLKQHHRSNFAKILLGYITFEKS